MKKYKLTKEMIKVGKRTLYRIQALKNFEDVKKGDLGGFIESESNLSQSGKCWVYKDARVYGNAKITKNGTVNDKARVYGNARVTDNAYVGGNARVCGDEVLDASVICYCT